MRLEDMKKDISETPEFIHTMIYSEVEKQLKNTNVISIQTRKVHKWTGTRVAAVAAICILSTSTIAYAGTKLYHMFTEKQGTYGIATGIKSDSRTEKITIPEKINEINISAGYIPDGMEWIDELYLGYPEHNRTGGFSFSSVLLDESDLSEVIQDTNVVESEERTFGDYEGVYLQYNDLVEDGSFNQRIYLLCPEMYRVITVYIGDDVTKEDAVKVVDNLEITETDTTIETADLYTWSEQVSEEDLEEENILASIEDDELAIHQIGEAFKISSMGEDSEGQYITVDNISVCVDSVQVSDNLQLLDQGNIPEEWLNSVDSEGKLTENTLSYIKSGDGIESVDKVVKTENLKQKLVYVTITYTNETEEEINHLLYHGNLMLIKHENREYQIYNPSEKSGEDYDRVTWNGVADISEMTYFSVSDNYGNGGNYISSLNPGESAQINMAWIVNENDLSDMYLDFNANVTAYGFSEAVLETGVVDIRP